MTNLGPKWIVVVNPSGTAGRVCRRQDDGTYVELATTEFPIAELADHIAKAQAMDDKPDLRAVTTDE